MFNVQRFAATTVRGFGFVNDTDKTKLDGITAGAQPNVIETVRVNNVALTVTNKAVNIDLSEYVKGTDVASALQYKGTVNSYSSLPNDPSTGHVYNITTAGGQDTHGNPIKAGDNVVYNGTGWDVLAGTTDLSAYQLKESGKGLSTNDYTTAEKNKLAALDSSAQPNVIESVSVNNSVLTVTNKAVNIDLSNYQLKESGKGLSTNDYTTAEKTKLANISSGAQQNIIEAVSVDNVLQTVTDKTAVLNLSAYVKKDGTKTLTTNDFTTTLKDKLDNIAAGAQQNVIETVKVNGTALTPDNKAVNIDLSNYQQKEAGKGLSTNDYTTAEKTKLANIATDTLLTTTVAADTYQTKTAAQDLPATVTFEETGISVKDGNNVEIAFIPVMETEDNCILSSSIVITDTDGNPVTPKDTTVITYADKDSLSTELQTTFAEAVVAASSASSRLTDVIYINYPGTDTVTITVPITS